MNARNQILLWGTAALIASAGLVGALLRERRSETTRHAVHVTGVPERGAALFFGAKRCSICHAVNGRGGRIGPDLGAIHPVKPAMGWLATVLWNHAPKMWRRMGDEKPPELNQEEMADLLAFLHEAGTGDRPGDSAAGARIFDEKGCAKCHARSSFRIQPGASSESVAWARAMWNHAQSMAPQIEARTGEWPEFIGDEMNDLIAFVSGGVADGGQRHEPALRGNPERGWNAFQFKCMQCHSVGGKGGHIGPEFGPDHNLPHSMAQFAAALWNHAPSMLKHARESSIPLPKLDGNEIKDIQSFLMSLQYFEPAGSPFLGQRVFTDRGCARCHGARGEGTEVAPRLRSPSEAYTTISLSSLLWRHGPEMWKTAERLGIPWPTLEANDVGDLISFLNAPPQQK